MSDHNPLQRGAAVAKNTSHKVAREIDGRPAPERCAFWVGFLSAYGGLCASDLGRDEAAEMLRQVASIVADLPEKTDDRFVTFGPGPALPEYEPPVLNQDWDDAVAGKGE